MLTLTPEQNRIAEAIIDFALDESEGSYLAVAGYAGTGKTTVMGHAGAKIIRERPSARIAYCAPTGKAASVLKEKLKMFGAFGKNCEVNTIHGLIYIPYNDKDGKLLFDLKPSIECDLIVVDEASMVTQETASDILSFGIPVIFIGDSGQLPPVGDTIFMPLVETSLKLTEVHRQALENPIIHAATKVREGEEIPKNLMGEKFYRGPYRGPHRKTILDMFIAKINDPEVMILCGRNKTRTNLNHIVRDSLGIKAPLPQSGEKLVCMKNAKELGIFNGQIMYAASNAKEVPDTNCFQAKLDGYGQEFIFYEGSLHTPPSNIFVKMDQDRDLIKAAPFHPSQRGPLVFDFGYACSVHKAQGSEWDNVLLIDERMGKQSEDDHRRWLYTGITRARSKLCILH